MGINAEQMEADKLRSDFLNEAGFKVLRFTNEQVLQDTDNTIKEIKANLKALSPTGRDGEGLLTIFTTRADTIFGVTFMVLAPESELVAQLTTAEHKAEVDEYLAYVKKRTELDRMANHNVTGVFSGSYAVNPFTGENIPIWISEYVKQYKKLLAMDGVELVIEDAAIHAIARQAIERNTGARGLRAIIEKIMQKVMYEIPGMKDVVKCTITEDNVVNHTDPLLERKAAEK